LSQHHYHAAKKLAHVKKHVRSDSFHGKPMTMVLTQWLAEVEGGVKTNNGVFAVEETPSINGTRF